LKETFRGNGRKHQGGGGGLKTEKQIRLKCYAESCKNIRNRTSLKTIDENAVYGKQQQRKRRDPLEGIRLAEVGMALNRLRGGDLWSSKSWGTGGGNQKVTRKKGGSKLQVSKREKNEWGKLVISRARGAEKTRRRRLKTVK